jgi:hypothetical protein
LVTSLARLSIRESSTRNHRSHECNEERSRATLLEMYISLRIPWAAGLGENLYIVRGRNASGTVWATPLELVGVWGGH